MNPDPIKLSSPAPMENKLRKYSFLYPVFFVLGAYAGRDSELSWFVIGLLFVIFAVLIKEVIAFTMILPLQKLRFVTPKQLSGSKMAGMITIPLTHLGMTVNVDKNEAVVVYKGLHYYIRNYTDGSFGVVFGQSIASSILTGRRYISQYKKAIVAINLIAFTVQSEMDKQVQGVKAI